MIKGHEEMQLLGDNAAPSTSGRWHSSLINVSYDCDFVSHVLRTCLERPMK
jgi:hypothetical protein